MFKSLNVKDHMLNNPVKVKASANIVEACDLITSHKISGLCVVDDHNKLIGVLSEMDCLRAVLSATYNKSGVGIVADYMTAGNLVTTGPNENIISVAEDMLRQNKRRLPVVSDGVLVGQITCRQLLRAVKDY